MKPHKSNNEIKGDKFPYEIDILINQKNRFIGIEIDGRFHESKDQQKRDIKKELACMKKGILLIRCITYMPNINRDGFVYYTDRKDNIYKNIIDFSKYVIDTLKSQKIISLEEYSIKIEKLNIHSKELLSSKNQYYVRDIPAVRMTSLQDNLWDHKQKLNPKFISKFSDRKDIKWHCLTCDERWSDPPRTLSKLKQCPFCSNARLGKKNSLLHVYPDLAKEFDYDKNYPLTPQSITCAFSKPLFWICSVNEQHKWETTIHTRLKGHGCRYCEGQASTTEYNLQDCYPRVAALWNLEKNGKKKPSDFTPKSPKEVGWKCLRGCEWKIGIVQQVNRNFCRECKMKY